MSLLTCKNLTLGYEGQIVVRDLSFAVEEGDYLCIVGENGSGKTTLMRTILGLAQPLGGEIVFGDGLARKEIGYLPQSTAIQRDFPASVREIVLSGCQGRCGLRPFYNKEEKALALQNVRRLGIEDLWLNCYRNLSGGQQQRVLLARALCAARKLLLLDEPVTGLDPGAAAETYGVIEDLNRREGLAIIMISHDVEQALGYARHVLHVGADIFYGTVDEYRRFSAAAGERGDATCAAAAGTCGEEAFGPADGAERGRRRDV